MADEKVTVGWRVSLGGGYERNGKRVYISIQEGLTTGGGAPPRLFAERGAAVRAMGTWASCGEPRLVRVTRRKRVSVEATLGDWRGQSGVAIDVRLENTSLYDAGFRRGDRVRITRIGGGK